MPLSPELDPEEFGTPIPDSEYSTIETCHTLTNRDESEMETEWNSCTFFYFFSVNEIITESTIIPTIHCPDI